MEKPKHLRIEQRILSFVEPCAILREISFSIVYGSFSKSETSYENAGKKAQQCRTPRFHKNAVQKCLKTLRHLTPQLTPIDFPLSELSVSELAPAPNE